VDLRLIRIFYVIIDRSRPCIVLHPYQTIIVNKLLNNFKVKQIYALVSLCLLIHGSTNYITNISDKFCTF
jgi:hypothetical protein